MLVCAKCNRQMRPKDNSVSFVEMAGERPYKLWNADLWECKECGAHILQTGENQQPVAYSHTIAFEQTLERWKPQYKAKEWNT